MLSVHSCLFSLSEGLLSRGANEILLIESLERPSRDAPICTRIAPLAKFCNVDCNNCLLIQAANYSYDRKNTGNVSCREGAYIMQTF